MGVKTSNQTFNDKNDKGVVHTGLKIERPIGKDASLMFRFPVPVQGKSSVFLILEGDDKSTKIILEDGKYIIPADWDNEKRRIYTKAFVEAGFTVMDFIDIAPKTVIKYAYFAKHPDHTEDNPMEGSFKFTLNTIKRDLEMIEGTIRTEDKEEYDRLIEKGFYEAKKPEEIK